MNKAEYTYLEIRKIDDNTVVKRKDVTGLSQRRIDKLDDAYNLNLNHKEYYTVLNTYTKPAANTGLNS